MPTYHNHMRTTVVLEKNKKVSVSMLRHIYLTSAYGVTVKKMELDSKAMAHSTAQQRDYIKE